MMLRSISTIAMGCLAASGCASQRAEPVERGQTTVTLPSVAASNEPGPDAETAPAAEASGAATPIAGSGHALAPLLGGGQELGEGFGQRGAGASAGGSAEAPQIGDTPPATGSLDREVIRAGVRAGLSTIKACYEQRLAANPGLRGRALMRFVIDPSGGVARASVTESTLADPELERCLEQAVTRLQFPPRTGGPAIVNYPFVFEPGS